MSLNLLLIVLGRGPTPSSSPMSLISFAFSSRIPRNTAVIRRDSESYHQWSNYWLILHLYLTILSPILHITLHPVFQILAILWLSLPQYQGALVVYERIVNPWVDQFESKVDDAVEEAHRGVRRWLWSRLGGVAWLLIGEGGDLVEGLMNIVMMALGGDNSATSATTGGNHSRQPAILIEPLRPISSVKGALSRCSSFEGAVDHSFDPTEEFVVDFVSMLRQGLYVFVNLSHNYEAELQAKRHSFEGGFKLGIFSYTAHAFLISPVTAESHELDVLGLAPVKLHIDSLMVLRSSGSQGLILECDSMTGNTCRNNVRAEIVLSDEADREILFNGLNLCLPHMLPQKRMM